MPAAAVIPAPEVHGIIAETKTSVVGITGSVSAPTLDAYGVLTDSRPHVRFGVRRSASVT